MKNDSKKTSVDCPMTGLSAGDALFIALKDEDTAHFLRTHFSAPELDHHIYSRRWMMEQDSRRFWQVTIIEKSSLDGKREQFFNIAHISLDAVSGQICQRWFFGNILLQEYLEFINRLGTRPTG